MKIVQLIVQNVKKIKALSITPDSNLVVIGGQNEQGKSSALDSIMYALGGKSTFDKQPIRKGAKSAKIECNLGDIIVTRTITESGGGNLTITNAEGQKFAAPQALLETFKSKLTFDPQAFASMGDVEQLRTLKQLVGLDFTIQDTQRKELYDKRTRVNADVKALKARLDSIPIVTAPKEEVSVAELTKQLQETQAHNQTQDSLEAEIERLDNNILNRKEEIAACTLRIEDLTENNEIDMSALETFKASLGTRQDESAIIQQLQAADQINQKVRQKKQADELSEQYLKTVNMSDDLTLQIHKIDEEKQTLLSAAKFPIEGLTFDEAGVFYNDVPFSQCSAAQKLRVSVAMGIALNPDLRVLLIRDGSLLDSANRQIIREMADDEDFQIWMECVGEGAECSVVMEDGEAKA